MGKRLRTTPALAVVAILLVSACGSSSTSPRASARGERIRAGAAAPAAARIGRAERVRRARPRRLPRRATSRRSRPATPSWTRRSAPTTSRSTARRSRSRRSGPAARAKASQPRSSDFQTATGITVQVDSIGSSHETVLKTRIEGGSPPDMAPLAQPTARARVRRRRARSRTSRIVHGRREAQG